MVTKKWEGGHPCNHPPLPPPPRYLSLVLKTPSSFDPPSASGPTGACVFGPLAQVGLYLQELVCLRGDSDSELRP